MSFVSGRTVGILGTGVSLPEKILTNDDLSKMVETNDEWIVERTGIRERRIAAKDQTTSDLAYEAALRAIDDAAISPEDLDMIIVATNTPDTLFPGVGPRVQGMLKAQRAGACDIQAGCASSVYVFTMAAAGIASGVWDRVLVIGAEVLSRIIDWKDRNTCVLFGDGAGAAVLGTVDSGAKGRVISASLRSDGEKHDFITLPGGLIENPATHDSVDQNLHCVHMKGNDVFKFTVRVLPPFLKDFCSKSDVSVEEIDWWIFHQANLRIMNSVLKRLRVPMEKAIVDLDKYGNTSGASIFLALHEAYQDERIKAGNKVLLTSFGSGMTYGAMIFEA